MIVLLPPSETKRDGGEGHPLDLASIGIPLLTPMRATLVNEVLDLVRDRAAARAALGLSEKQDFEIDRNAALLTSPTMPAISRYTGVLYDALDVDSLRGSAAMRARSVLMIGSALFGMVRAIDPIPAYRLSAGSKLPDRPSLAARWKPSLERVLHDWSGHHLIVDLRSGAYAALGRAPEAVTVDVVSEKPDGTRAVVSHFNKAHKGRLARALVSSRAEPDDAAQVAAIATRAGMQVERDGNKLTVVVPA